MSIEVALSKLRSAQICHPNAVQFLIDEAITAIQQAEAKTDEPVAFGIRASNTGRICQFVSSDNEDEVAQLGEYRKGIVAPLYAHPAPGVPDDSKRLDYLQDRGATIDLIPGVAGFYPMRFRVGGLRSSANIDVRAAIDAAMLVTKEEPNV